MRRFTQRVNVKRNLDSNVEAAKLVESGRQKTLKLGVGEKWWAAISQAYKRLERWLATTAPQLDCQQTFERYLCWNNPLNPENWLASPST